MFPSIQIEWQKWEDYLVRSTLKTFLGKLVFTWQCRSDEGNNQSPKGVFWKKKSWYMGNIRAFFARGKKYSHFPKHFGLLNVAMDSIQNMSHLKRKRNFVFWKAERWTVVKNNNHLKKNMIYFQNLWFEELWRRIMSRIWATWWRKKIDFRNIIVWKTSDDWQYPKYGWPDEGK
jgi:hypothetical protein